MSSGREFEPTALLEQITAATEELSATVAGLSDADVRDRPCCRGGRAGTC